MKRVTTLMLALGLLIGMASGPMAQPARAGSLKVCGEVTVYVKATALATGALTINGVPFVIAAGTVLDPSVAMGADLCLDVTTNQLGLLTGAVVTANVATHLKLCGVVIAYTKASAAAAGVLRIGAKTLTTAVGSALPASVVAGADLCADLTLDAFGRVSNGDVTANVETHVKVCGMVSAVVKATATSEGALTIAGRTFKVAVDEDLPAMVKAGADLCLDLTLNGFGQVSNCGAIVNVQSTLDVCGQVTAYAAATSTTNGSLAIGGATKVVAAGADVDGEVAAAAYLKLRLTIDAFGRVAKATVLNVGVSVADACGTGSGGPGTTAPPSPTQEPGATIDPGPTTAPDPSDAPGPSDGPDATDGPRSSSAPSQGVGGVTDCTTGGVAGSASGSGNGTLLPDTASLGRAVGVVATNAIPLLAIGLLGGFAAWYRTRRHREDLVEAEAGDIAAEARASSPATDEVDA